MVISETVSWETRITLLLEPLGSLFTILGYLTAMKSVSFLVVEKCCIVHFFFFREFIINAVREGFLEKDRITDVIFSLYSLYVWKEWENLSCCFFKGR